MTRGYFGVGVYNPKVEANIGSLYRTAHLYEASYIFTVGKRYEQQASDTPKTANHTPLFHFEDIVDMRNHLPRGVTLIGVEMSYRSVSLPEFVHPERAVYLLGAEDSGLPEEVLKMCHEVVQLPSIRPQSMNVAVAGSIVIYDRFVKRS